MNERMGKRKKIDLARTALREVLRKIPRGTWLSVVAFGHRNARNTTNNADFNATATELIRPPAVWNPDDPATGLDTVMMSINNLVPQNYSPVAESLQIAKEEGFPRNADYKGAKVILALTDGDDNLFKWANIGNNAAQRVAAIRKFLPAVFVNSDISVNVVCFAARNDPETINAQKQFGVVEGLDPPGLFLVEPNPNELATKLEEAIRPRLRLFQGGLKARGSPTEGLLGTRVDQNLNWKRVQPGFYTGRVQNVYRQDLDPAPGQLLNLTLKRDLGQVLFTRGMLCDFVREIKGSAGEDRWHTQRDAWHVSVAQNQYVQASGLLRQLVAVEQPQQVRAFQAGVPLRQTKPQFVWLELKAQGSDKPHPFLWHNEFGYPAPTFRLEAPVWPASAGDPAEPELHVWWSENPNPDDSGRNRPLNHAAGRFQVHLSDLEGKTVSLMGNRVTLTTVKADRKRQVVVSTEGGIKRAEKPCLVVEIDHDKGKQVWLRADNLGHQGEEHLFYPAVGKYTAVFWGVSDPHAKNFQLTVISLDDFKRTAGTNGHAVFRPGAPVPRDNGPQWQSLQTLP
jgi:hypothetical protein